MSNNKFNFVDDIDSIKDNSHVSDEKEKNEKLNIDIEKEKLDNEEIKSDNKTLKAKEKIIVEESQKVNSNDNSSIKVEKRVYLSFEMRVALMLIFIIILFSSTCFFMVKAFNLDKKDKITYSEVGNIKYDVCLNDNDYYSKTCLPEGRQYLSSIVKNIPTNFSYNVNFSEDIKYNIKYYIVAKIKIFDANDSSKILYEDEELLVPSKSLNGNSNKISVNENTSIDYSSYENYVNSYKKNYSVDANASLNVSLYVDDSSESRVVSSMNIPIGEKTFGINSDNVNVKNNEVTINDDTWNNVNSIYAFIGAFLSLICLIFIVKLTRFVCKSITKKNKYQTELLNILRNFDRDIVIARNGYESNVIKNIVKVDSFKELLDAKENLGKPIIYSKVNSVKSEFIVEDECTLYKFIMKEADYS